MSPPASRERPALRPVKGLTRAFVLVSVLEILLQVVLLGLVIGGLVTPDLQDVSLLVGLVAGSLYGAVAISARILGTLAMGVHVGNLKRLGMQGMRLSGWAWLVFWMPLVTRWVWVLAYVQYREVVGIQAVWVLVAAAAVFGGVLLHELWRASAPDQIEHWRHVPLSGVMVAWSAATVVDALIPLVQPFGILATIVLLRRLADRSRDKAVVVAEVRLPGQGATATPDAAADLPLSAGSAP